MFSFTFELGETTTNFFKIYQHHKYNNIMSADITNYHHINEENVYTLKRKNTKTNSSTTIGDHEITKPTKTPKQQLDETITDGLSVNVAEKNFRCSLCGYLMLNTVIQTAFGCLACKDCYEENLRCVMFHMKY